MRNLFFAVAVILAGASARAEAGTRLVLDCDSDAGNIFFSVMHYTNHAGAGSYYLGVRKWNQSANTLAYENINLSAAGESSAGFEFTSSYSAFGVRVTRMSMLTDLTAATIYGCSPERVLATCHEPYDDGDIGGGGDA